MDIAQRRKSMFMQVMAEIGARGTGRLLSLINALKVKTKARVTKQQARDLHEPEPEQRVEHQTHSLLFSQTPTASAAP